MKKIIALLLVSILGIAMLAGCGGGGKQASSGTTPPDSSAAATPARTEPMTTAELLELYNKLNEEGDAYKSMTYEELRDTYMGGLEGEVFSDDGENIIYMWRSSEDDIENFSFIIDKASGKCKLYAANNLW